MEQIQNEIYLEQRDRTCRQSLSIVNAQFQELVGGGGASRIISLELFTTHTE